ncbi:rhodopsin kinase GRK7 [Calypte anna]|uniref:G protein-coupled receptor kinase n=1 Tax=Calypte anna TaxID=9244 RepID=A0A091HR52_CALAN|nr:rhodopsin kinase GRK7 [Calypte anna]KFO98758.1 G protein-coupled receptor kinase 7A [Calypte anna]
MCDMGGLDNLIANTAYLQARKSGDADAKEMQKRRRSLSLPKIEQCGEVRQSLVADYDSICEQQPIGKRFFRDFLETVPEYVVARDFLDEVSSWELAEDNIKSSTMENIFTNFLKTGAKNYLSFMSSDLANKCQTATAKDYEAIIQLVKDETKQFLKDKPFQDFQSSPLYDKFLQWKVFEKQPVTEKYFYEFRVLGKGGFGEVCAIQVKNTGKMYACKKLDKKRLKKKGGEKMALLEKEILEKVNSPFIVTLAYAYESKTHLCLVMSLMNGGDLKYHIYNVGERGLDVNRVIYYSAQITCGILHLHSIKILYRDMKPENVLLDDNGNCRLSDLGLAVEVKEGKTINQRAGTNGYMAPEILKDENYSYPVDWFAMGCSIYEMIAGRTPFKDYKEKVNKDEVKRRTLEDEVKFEHANFSEEAKDICRLFLAKKKENRLGSRNEDDDPRKHSFFKTINFHRLEANLVDPPFVPDPSVVYAKDIGDIADFSEVRGIEFDDKDKKFFQKFATGAVPIPWQEEIIETGLFEELNDPNRVESGKYANGGEAKSGVCLLL